MLSWKCMGLAGCFCILYPKFWISKNLQCTGELADLSNGKKKCVYVVKVAAAILLYEVCYAVLHYVLSHYYIASSCMLLLCDMIRSDISKDWVEMLDLDPNWDIKWNSQSLERVGFGYFAWDRGQIQTWLWYLINFEAPQNVKISKFKVLGSNEPLNLSTERQMN